MQRLKMIDRGALLRAWTGYFSTRGQSESLATIQRLQDVLKRHMRQNARKGVHDEVATLQGMAYGVLEQCRYMVSSVRGR